MMRVPDYQTLARILQNGPVRTDRTCRRRNLAKRLAAGKTRDLRTADLHMIRQARYIERVGRPGYDALHTVTLTGKDAVMTETELQTLFTHLRAYFPREAVQRDAVTIFLTTDMATIRFAAPGGRLQVMGYSGFPEASALSDLARVDAAMGGAIQKAFVHGPVNDVATADQIKAARMANDAGKGPIYAS